MRRVYHHYLRWECFHAGMFAESFEDLDAESARRQYSIFLADDASFRDALGRVTARWPISCEHFLTNADINRIAWLGQASMCIATGIPRKYRGGFHFLNEEQQRRANATAEEYLAMWLGTYDLRPFVLEPDPPYPTTLAARTVDGPRRRVELYLRFWEQRGYTLGIEDDVPEALFADRVAPSWRAIALALLKNDFSLLSLGFGVSPSEWYGILKRAALDTAPSATA